MFNLLNLTVTLTLLLTQLTSMAPPQEVCNQVKTLLSKAIYSVKDLTTQNRNDLWKHSFRGLAYQVLEQVYQPTDQWESISGFLEYVRDGSQEYHQYKSVDDHKIQTQINHLEKLYQQKLLTHQNQSDQYASLDQENEGLKLSLDQLRTQVISENPDIEQEVKTLTTMKGILIQMRRSEIPN